MAQLFIAAAINIAVGLLINALFPPPDIEGPRLSELNFTSAAYGKFVNVIFGTDRVAGNIIDTTDPAIEEVVTKESVGGKGGGLFGGGQKIKVYTYFLTARISWGIEGATDIIRLWGDGKTILDVTGTETQSISALFGVITAAFGLESEQGVALTFYPGGIDQLQDPEEVTRRGSDIPAYGHLTTIKLDRLPLANFGNRIPNFTAEIAYNSTDKTTINNMVEPSGLALSTDSRWDYDPDRNQLLASKNGPAPAFTADASSLQFQNSITISASASTRHTMGRDGFAYMSLGGGNRAPLNKIDLDSGITVGSVGDSSIPLTPDDFNGFANLGTWYQLSSRTTGFGVRSTVFHLGVFPAGGAPNGAVVDADQIGNLLGFNPIRHIISTADGLTVGGDDLGGSSLGICDHDRGIFYIFQDDDNAGTYNLVRYTPTFATGIAGTFLNSVSPTLVKTFSRGTFAGGDDFEGTGNPAGWAVNRRTGELILSNGTSMILYNPDTDIILAQKANASFISEFNYYASSQFGYAISNATNGTLRVIDTRTLEIIKDIRTDDLPWPSGVDGIINGGTSTWDDLTQAIYLGRINSDAATDFRVLKVFVNHRTGLGVTLDTVVLALSTTYQRQTMAGLKAADVNVTTLAGDTVLGYTLNRQSTMKSALQPLRDRFLFDAHQSDWGIKFPKRGAVPTVTIPEEDVGILKRGRSLTDTPAVTEIRLDDLSLPMRLGVRYRNRDEDYQLDVEHDKRHLFPNPTMQSKSDLNIEIPLVEQPTEMKRLAQKILLTLWNERVSYKTVIPWTYIALDATDVFNMGVFNETHQLRMAENDLGLGWAIDLTGVIEDTKSFSSTLAGGSSLGHVGSTIPGILPTRLTPLDAPLLSLQDFLTVPLSNAYMAVGAFEDGWPGATVLKSPNDSDYTSTGTANEEAAVARVTVAPGAWNFVNGDFPNRWQEVADDGTMVIAPLRRADVWASAATEEMVLAGANTIAVVRAADNTVEILTFQNAVLNDDNTVTLTRLLRGRLGTEDVADLGITANDAVVLISDEANVKEAGPIIKQALTLSELNTVLFFRGVTIGTLLEDAPVISATYTGRDLKPYSPVHAAAVGDGSGGLDVTWERRARGPLAAEWVDGTGEVVLNENIEQYRVALSVTGNSRFVVKTVNDVKLANFTKAEVDLGGTGGSFDDAIMPTRAGFSEPDGDMGGSTAPLSGGWVQEDDVSFQTVGTSTGGISGPPAASADAEGNFMVVHLQPSTAGDRGRLSYELDIVGELGMDLNNILQTTFTCSMWVAMHDSGTDNPGMTVFLSLFNDAGANLAEVSTGLFDEQDVDFSDGTFTQIGSDQNGNDFPTNNQKPLSITGVAGATKLRIRIEFRNFGTVLSVSRFGVDVIRVSASGLAPDIIAEVEQVSDTGLFSPVHIRQVT